MSETEIRPALTPEEWQRAKVPTGEPKDYGRVSIGLSQGTLSGGCDDTFYDRDFTTDEAHQIAALANASLPDDDRRKFTREDVDALRAEADWSEEQTRNVGRACPVEYLPAWRLRAIADRIAALLPPESE